MSLYTMREVVSYGETNAKVAGGDLSEFKLTSADKPTRKKLLEGGGSGDWIW